MASITNPNQYKFVLNNGREMPALGFGTSLSDNTYTRNAVKAAVEVGFRHLDAAERYRNEAEVGAALKELFAAGTVRREDLFVTTKLWNNNHRPERVKPALGGQPGQARARRGRFVPGAHALCVPARRRPRPPPPERGRRVRRRRHVGGDLGRDGKPCRRGTYRSDRAVRHRCRNHPKDCRFRPIKPAVVEVESHPYHPQWELHEYLASEGIILLAFASLGHALEPRLLDDPLVVSIAQRFGKTPAQVLLAWGIQRGSAVLTGSVNPKRISENFDVTALPESAIQEISERLVTRYRFDSVADGGVPGFAEVPSGS